ncbi:hypothetical protein [Cryobacterium sp. TMT2-4]|uniref:hypothetical protein n=1 Tax=Cryobacterium sp. TMT2-4 TaxID=1259254 RepID=UPI001F540001|nr:hypothetical protein [Cryobacterium sp. TMT2-4]
MDSGDIREELSPEAGHEHCGRRRRRVGRRDVDITSAVPSIRLAGTIVSRNGELTFLQDHPKRPNPVASWHCPRSPPMPLAKVGSMGLDELLFQSRGRAPR